MRKYLISTILFVLATLVTGPVVYAQIQQGDFSGNSADSYQCFTKEGVLLPDTPQFDSAQGEFYCMQDGQRIKAVLKPLTLQYLEVLFVRVVYAIWALIASFSFLMIVYLGYQYLISRGDPTQIKAIRERIIKFIIGFALVFLAVPILVTFFKLLGVNNQVQCYQGLAGGNNVGIGFQFFFTDLCTDPNGVAVSDPCDFGENANGLACSTPGDKSPTCFTSGSQPVCYVCTQGRVWNRTVGFGNCF